MQDAGASRRSKIQGCGMQDAGYNVFNWLTESLFTMICQPSSKIDRAVSRNSRSFMSIHIPFRRLLFFGIRV